MLRQSDLADRALAIWREMRTAKGDRLAALESEFERLCELFRLA